MVTSMRELVLPFADAISPAKVANDFGQQIGKTPRPFTVTGGDDVQPAPVGTALRVAGGRFAGRWARCGCFMAITVGYSRSGCNVAWKYGVARMAESKEALPNQRL